MCLLWEKENKMEIDKKILDLANGITYTRPTLFERIKIFFGWKFIPERIKRKTFFELIPKVKAPKFKSRIGEIV